MKLYIPVYASTLLTSAFLLFLIQPMFGKMILPVLGGSAHIWITALLFYQFILLLGYAYAHISAVFLSVRTQAVLHIALIALCILSLPISIPESWQTAPEGSDNPAFWLLGLMTFSIGGPFFVLSASAPMFQRWFSKTPHKDAESPYFLYAISNLGSLSALLLYPFIIEHYLPISKQAEIWGIGYIILAGLTIMAATLVWKYDDLKHEKLHITDKDHPHLKQKLLWLALSFAPSSLLLGVTTYITVDLASIPLMWVIPLALYLTTYIIAFSKKDYLPDQIIYPLHFCFLIFAFLLFLIGGGKYFSMQTIVHLNLFFLSALIAHKALSYHKPKAKHLTEFYLLISVGGALGGLFNAIIAPVIFKIPLEYPLMLGLITFARYSYGHKSKSITETIREDLKRNYIPVALIIICASVISLSPSIMNGPIRGTAVFILPILMLALLYKKRFSFAIAITLLLISYPGDSWRSIASYIYLERNFYGVIRVNDNLDTNTRLIRHGTTVHGAQYLSQKKGHPTPITYYGKNTGVYDAFQILDSKMARASSKEQNVAVLGLGAGSLACYGITGRHFDFYEIDPAVVRVAENPDLFTFLSDCGSPYSIFLGDARLKISEAEDSKYDMIVMDTFSSDNIPVHLMTKEAFEIYKEKLAPGGILVAHISNRHLNLKPVVDALAQEIKGRALFKFKPKEKNIDGKETVNLASLYTVITFDEENYNQFQKLGDWHPHEHPESNVLWTDEYNYVLGIMK